MSDDAKVLSYDEVLDELRAMFEERARQPGDVDMEDVMRVTGIKSHVGVSYYMQPLVDEGRYIELTDVYDRRTGRSKTVWRRVRGAVLPAQCDADSRASRPERPMRATQAKRNKKGG
jgi:hypothetical protein